MSDMECPFCQQAIVCIYTQDADEYATWFCPRCVAERKWYAFGNKTLWQEFICTLKALDVAMSGLTSIRNDYSDNAGRLDAVARMAQNYLDDVKQILETKDVK